MSLFDMFTPKQPEQVPAPQQQQQAVTPGNPVVPGSPDTPTPKKDAEGSNPLDNYKDLWEPTTTNNDQTNPSTFIPLDPTKLQEVVSKASFVDAITPENVQAIAAGGEDAVKAFRDSINSVAQNVMMQATLAANKMTEKAVAKALEVQTANLPNLLKKQNTLDSNPVFKNPAVKPVIEAVQHQLAIKHPDASASELADMAKNFVLTVAGAFNPQSNTVETPKGEDWEKFFEPN